MNTPKRRGGRAKLPYRPKALSLRFHPVIYSKIAERADKRGVSMAQIVRELVALGFFHERKDENET